MCGKGRDDRSSGFVEEVSIDSHPAPAYQGREQMIVVLPFSSPTRMITGNNSCNPQSAPVRGSII